MEGHALISLEVDEQEIAMGNEMLSIRGSRVDARALRGEARQVHPLRARTSRGREERLNRVHGRGVEVRGRDMELVRPGVAASR